MSATVQRENVRTAARALAPLAREHELVLSHGNGPQVGLLALQSAAYPAVDPYPLDILDAQTEGMIGYLIEQELGNLLAPEVPLATILTQIEVDPDDPSFHNPTKFVGPQYSKDAAEKIERESGWTLRKDGDYWRRVVPSPVPKKIFEIRPIRWLLENGTVVICAGGGGIPVVPGGVRHEKFSGVEAVIDKDLASCLLARELEADLFIMATDVEGVYTGWGTPSAKLIRETRPEELETFEFPAGSMGPKVAAACEFVWATGNRAAIGALNDIAGLVTGDSGTQVRCGDRDGEC